MSTHNKLHVRISHMQLHQITPENFWDALMKIYTLEFLRIPLDKFSSTRDSIPLTSKCWIRIFFHSVITLVYRLRTFSRHFWECLLSGVAIMGGINDITGQFHLVISKSRHQLNTILILIVLECIDIMEIERIRMQGRAVIENLCAYPINAERFLQHLLSERLRLLA